MIRQVCVVLVLRIYLSTYLSFKKIVTLVANGNVIGKNNYINNKQSKYLVEKKRCDIVERKYKPLFFQTAKTPIFSRELTTLSNSSWSILVGLALFEKPEVS